MQKVKNSKNLEGEKLSNEIKYIQNELKESIFPLSLRHQIEEEFKVLSKKKFQEKKGGIDSSIEQAKSLANECTEKGTKFIVIDLNIGSNKKGLNNSCKLFSESCKTTAACFLTRDEKQVFINCCVPDSLTSKINASQWAQSIAKIVNGKGGGRPTFAAANGDGVGSFDEALKFAEKYASELLK